MGLCERLMAASQGIWEAEKQHPFVQGMGDGTLDGERFRFYLEQDYLFLIEYAKVFALAVSKAHDLETMSYFSALCADTLNVEMDLHRSYCGEFGISPAQLEGARMARTTAGYTGHLLSVAARGGLLEILAAVLPCQWGYAEIAGHLRATTPLGEPRYAKWAAMYVSEEFQAYGAWLRARLDSLGAGITQEAEARLAGIFQQSSRWEYLFWEMAWRKEMWDMPAGTE